MWQRRSCPSQGIQGTDRQSPRQGLGIRSSLQRLRRKHSVPTLHRGWCHLQGSRPTQADGGAPGLTSHHRPTARLAPGPCTRQWSIQRCGRCPRDPVASLDLTPEHWSTRRQALHVEPGSAILLSDGSSRASFTLCLTRTPKGSHPKCRCDPAGAFLLTREPLVT